MKGVLRKRQDGWVVINKDIKEEMPLSPEECRLCDQMYEMCCDDETRPALWDGLRVEYVIDVKNNTRFACLKKPELKLKPDGLFDIKSTYEKKCGVCENKIPITNTSFICEPCIAALKELIIEKKKEMAQNGK